MPPDLTAGPLPGKMAVVKPDHYRTSHYNPKEQVMLPTPSPHPRRRDVAGLLGNIYQAHPPRLRHRRLLTDDIIVLRQPRQTFDDEYIASLAENIKLVGLLKALIVVGYTPEKFRQYLRAKNRVWGTRYRLRQFHPSRDGRSPVNVVCGPSVVSGGRAFRA